MRKLILSIILIFILATPCLAADYFVFKGDSLTIAIGEHAPESRYLGSYSYMMDLGTAIKENLGCSGQKLQDVVSGGNVTCNAYGWDGIVSAGHDGSNWGVIPRLQANSSSPKRTVVLLMGSNDLAGGTSAATLEGYTTTWSENVRAADAGAKLIGITLPPAGQFTEGQEAQRLLYNTWIRETSVSAGVFDYIVDICTNVAFDASPDYITDTSNTTYYDADKNHLKDSGELIIANAVKAVIVANGISNFTYYVNATGGDDSRTQSQALNSATPWLTIQKCVDNVVAGDTCHVDAGNYPEEIVLKMAGTSSNPITYQAHGTVTISTMVSNKAWSVIDGFTFNASTIADAGSQFSALLLNTNGTDSIVKNCIFDLDVANSIPILVIGARTTIDTCSIINTWSAGYQIAGANSTVKNCTFTSNKSADALHILADDITITGNTFDGWSAFTPIKSGTLKVGMRYYFLDVGTDANFSNVGAGSPPYTAGEGNGFTATGTTPTSWGGAEIDLSNHPDIIQAANSYGYDSVKRCIFEKNVIKNGSGSIQLGNITDDGNTNQISDWVFRNNVITGTPRALNLFAPNFKFYNNTFYMNADSSSFNLIINAASAGTANYVDIRNNLFVLCGTPTSQSSGWYGGDAVTSPIADYNLVVGSGAGTTKNNTEWTGGMGICAAGTCEAHGLNGVDPVFSNAASGNFALTSNSPTSVRKGGVNLTSTGFSTDILGNERPSSGGWSMGAYEYGNVPVKRYYVFNKTILGKTISAGSGSN